MLETLERVSMSEKRLPFFMRAHRCPACGATGKHRQFRSRTFGPGKTESDSHVLTYVWNDPQYVQVHPPLYFIYFCTDCFYAAPAEQFTEPESSLYGRAVPRALAAAREKDDPALLALGRRIDYDNITFETALWLHLLAIYIQCLPGDDLRDHYMIARLYLRVAWLYREEQAAKAEATPDGAPEKPEDTTPQAVLDALKEFDAVLHQGHEGRDKIVAALKADAGRRGTRNKQVYDKALDTIERLFEALHSEAYRLKSTFNQTYVAALDDDKSYSTAFLDELKGKWVYAPADEPEALRGAIEHFEKAIANDARLNDPDPFFKTSSLIIDLELRCNDLDAAFKKARGVVNAVMKDREGILRRIAEAENESHKMQLMKLLTAANRSIERAAELNTQVVDLVIEQETPRIQEILQEHAKSTTGQKKVALLSKGISHGIIHRLEERKQI